MLPFAGLAACSSDDSSAPTIAASTEDAASTRPDPTEPSAEQSAENTSVQQAEASAEKAAADGKQMAQNDAGGNADTGGLPKLSEDNAQAKSLSYKHIASDVDQSKQPRYKEGQKCSNCAVYQGKSSEEWGPCPIFAGKAVKATGWCSAYAPMSA